MRNWNEVNELCEMAHLRDGKENRSVLILFDDGELCYTKGAELFGQRSLHQFEMPLIDKDDLDRAEGFSGTAFGYRCIFPASREDAMIIRAAMKKVIDNLSE